MSSLFPVSVEQPLGLKELPEAVKQVNSWLGGRKISQLSGMDQKKLSVFFIQNKSNLIDWYRFIQASAKMDKQKLEGQEHPSFRVAQNYLHTYSDIHHFQKFLGAFGRSFDPNSWFFKESSDFFVPDAVLVGTEKKVADENKRVFLSLFKKHHPDVRELGGTSGSVPVLASDILESKHWKNLMKGPDYDWSDLDNSRSPTWMVISAKLRPRGEEQIYEKPAAQPTQEVVAHPPQEESDSEERADRRGY